MTDINDSNNVNNIRPIRFKGKAKPESSSDPAPSQIVPNENNDLNNAAGMLGRSQVGHRPVAFNGSEYEIMQRDLKVLHKNPDLVFTSDKVFEKAYEKSGSYGHAARVQVAFVKEFKKQ